MVRQSWRSRRRFAPPDYFPGSARIRVVRIVGNDVSALLPEKLDTRGSDIPVSVRHEDPASFESSAHRFNLALWTIGLPPSWLLAIPRHPSAYSTITAAHTMMSIEGETLRGRWRRLRSVPVGREVVGSAERFRR